MQIKILGQGCSKCAELYKEVVKADQELQSGAEIVKVENMKEIVGFGVMRTPALVINGEVKVVGKVPTIEEIKDLIKAGIK
jgi:small redox-active disulfide protein 2